ncbi:hypothetical protein Pd630_LPD03650 [Rhodococcus opacus PD630]|nr:hypothetical protein Pd630_LPD03650 [Rhodococcus opacus PD630]
MSELPAHASSGISAVHGISPRATGSRAPEVGGESAGYAMLVAA